MDTTFLLVGICFSVAFTLELCGKGKYSPEINHDSTSPTEAVAHSYPWQVILHHVNAQRCGGAVIAAQWLVTAASCVNQYISHPEEWTITLGAHERSDMKQRVTAIEVHPNYSLFYGDYDLALVRVNQLEFSDTVSPVCLLSTIQETSNAFVTTGWNIVDGQREAKLQQQLVLIQNSKVCSGFNANWIPEKMDIILPISGSSGCLFDTGDPLFVQNNGIFFLYGVQSRHASCGATTCIYTRVGAMVDWINDVISQHASNLELQSMEGNAPCPKDHELPAPQGSLRSPQYSQNLDCSWILQLDVNQTVEISVMKMHTPNLDCKNTFFSIEQKTNSVGSVSTPTRCFLSR
ncbi:chymotrypsin A isoform X2 [Amia ocellicauda]|uniref:chymotrypsin A isoform X2 n=1 Tax=Amia ocellicauda TaxID=2972642 RepID=UPI003463DC48